MNAAATSYPPPTAHPTEKPELPARFRDLVAAEWIALWSLRSTAWALGITALAVVGINANGAYQDRLRYVSLPDHERRDGFLEFAAGRDAFGTASAMVLLLALCAVGATAVTGEYGSGQIRTTFAAVPARRAVMAAKVLVVVAVTTVAGAAMAVASYAVSRAILPGTGSELPLTSPGMWRIVAASALLAPVAALAGMALGVVLRHGAAAVACGAVLLELLPVAVGDDRYWTSVFDHALPYSAWFRLVDIHYVPGLAYPWTVAGAWTVYAVWALAAATLTVTLPHHRDH